MSHFLELDLPTYDLYETYEKLIEEGKIYTPEIDDGLNYQICINTTPGNEDDYLLGANSLEYDWSKAETINGNLFVPKREGELGEHHFTELCTQFRGTAFEDAYNALKSKYTLGRVRIMNSMPKSCLSWHEDTSIRVHYPMKTQLGCFMVIDEEVKVMPKNTWWETNTLIPHTAVNASYENRLHLVACILDTVPTV